MIDTVQLLQEHVDRSNTMNGHALLQRAGELIQAGDVERGAALCRQRAANRNRDIPDALHLLAMATRSSDPQDAERLFRRVCRVRRDSRACVSISPISCVRTIERAKRSRSARSDRDGARFRSGLVQPRHSAARHRTAGGSGTIARARRTRCRRPMQPVGNCAPQSRNSVATFAAAISACRTGLRHAPAAARLHYSLGQLLREDCRFAEAAQAYEAAHRTRLRRARSLSQSRRGTSGGRPQRAGSHRTRHRRHAPSAGRIAAPVARRPALGDRRARRSVGAPVASGAATHPQDATLWHTLAGLLKKLDRIGRVGRGARRSEAFGLSAHARISWCWKQFATRAPATSRRQRDCSTASSPSIRRAPDIASRSSNTCCPPAIRHARSRCAPRSSRQIPTNSSRGLTAARRGNCSATRAAAGCSTTNAW